MKFARGLRFIRRWGTVPLLKEQNVSEHSFMVVVYVSSICHKLGLPDYLSLRAIRLAALHDCLESWTGDIPGPAKRFSGYNDHNIEQAMGDMSKSYGLFKVQTESECPLCVSLVKMADSMDEVAYLNEELAMGNTLVVEKLEAAKDRAYLKLAKLCREAYTAKIDPVRVQELKRELTKSIAAHRARMPGMPAAMDNKTNWDVSQS